MISTIHGLCRALVPRLPVLPVNQMKSLLGNGLLRRTLYTVQPCTTDRILSNVIPRTTLLAPAEATQLTQVRGLKYLTKVHRRCKDCHLMLVDGVMHNFCKAHPRHNQKRKTKRPQNTWILTNVSVTKIRPY